MKIKHLRDSGLDSYYAETLRGYLIERDVCNDTTWRITKQTAYTFAKY
jgi:hypothetical protein